MEFHNKLMRYHFSFPTVCSHIKHFLILKPIPVAEMTLSYLNAAAIFILLSVSNLGGYVCSRMLNINLFQAVGDVVVGIFLKVYFSFLILAFAFLISKGYSMELGSGKIRFSYFYASLLSTVHFPLSIFLINIEKRNKTYPVLALLLVLQGLLAHWLMCQSAGQVAFPTKKYRFALLSIGAHVVFFSIFGGALYRG